MSKELEQDLRAINQKAKVLPGISDSLDGIIAAGKSHKRAKDRKPIKRSLAAEIAGKAPQILEGAAKIQKGLMQMQVKKTIQDYQSAIKKDLAELPFKSIEEIRNYPARLEGKYKTALQNSLKSVPTEERERVIKNLIDDTQLRVKRIQFDKVMQGAKDQTAAWDRQNTELVNITTHNTEAGKKEVAKRLAAIHSSEEVNLLATFSNVAAESLKAAEIASVLQSYSNGRIYNGISVANKEGSTEQLKRLLAQEDVKKHASPGAYRSAMSFLTRAKTRPQKQINFTKLGGALDTAVKHENWTNLMSDGLEAKLSTEVVGVQGLASMYWKPGSKMTNSQLNDSLYDIFKDHGTDGLRLANKFYKAITETRRRGPIATKKALIGFNKGSAGRNELEELEKVPPKAKLALYGQVYSPYDRGLASRDLVTHGDNQGWDERSLNTYMKTQNIQDPVTRRRALRELFNHIQTSKDFSPEEKRRVAVMATLDNIMPKHGFDRDKLIEMSQKNINLFDSVRRLRTSGPIQALHTALGGDQRKTDAATYTILLQLRNKFTNDTAGGQLLDALNDGATSGELSPEQRDFLDEQLPEVVEDLIGRNFVTEEKLDRNVLYDVGNYLFGDGVDPVTALPKTPKGVRGAIPNYIWDDGENYPHAKDNFRNFNNAMNIDHLNSDTVREDSKSILYSFHPNTQKDIQRIANNEDGKTVDAWIAITPVADGTQVLKLYVLKSNNQTPTAMAMLNRQGKPVEVNLETIAKHGIGAISD